jgi:hypothetical protein
MRTLEDRQMALALHSHHNAAGVTRPSWLRWLYQVIIDARQKQADARIAAHLRDLPDEVMRKAGIPDDAIEALKARDHTPYPQGLHGRVTTRAVLQGLRERMDELAGS